MSFLRRLLWQFDVTREFKGFKLPQTAAAGIISDSKNVMYKFFGLKNMEGKLNARISDYKAHTTTMQKMRAPEPDGAKAKKYHVKYVGKRRQLGSAVAAIGPLLKTFSFEFNQALKFLKDITFNSQIVLFELRDDLNRFLDVYHKMYRRLLKGNVDTSGIKRFADRVNELMQSLQSQLRSLWEASKSQERRVPSKYIIEEWSLRGHAPISREMRKIAIDIGQRIVRKPDPNNIEDVVKYGQTMLSQNVRVQKFAKIFFHRLDHLLNRTRASLSALDPRLNRKFLITINKLRKNYDSTVKEITIQSRRLFLDIRIRPVRMKIVRPKIIRRAA